MRRIALGAVVAALLVAAAVALGARGPAVPPTEHTLSWTTGAGGRAFEHEPGQDLLGYWGALTPRDTATPGGTYQAKCVWLTHSGSDYMLCDIVVFMPSTGTLVLSGLVQRRTPSQGLFATDSGPKLAMTAGTGSGYTPRHGYADVDQGRLDLHVLAK
jgi:hypothetical protein